MTGLSLIHSRAVPCAGRNSSTWPQHRNKTLATNPRRPRRLVAGRLSHYSALYEVQHDQGMPLDAVQHLHHMVHGESSAGWKLEYRRCCRTPAAARLIHGTLITIDPKWRACRLQQRPGPPVLCHLLRTVRHTGRAAVQPHQRAQRVLRPAAAAQQDAGGEQEDCNSPCL